MSTESAIPVATTATIPSPFAPLDEAHFKRAYAANFKSTVKFAQRLLGTNLRLPQDGAEDIAQWAWGRAWEKRAQYDGRRGSSVHTWVNRILYMRFIDFASRDQHVQHESGLKAVEEFQTYESMRKLEQRIALEKYLSLLNPDEYAIVVQHYFNGTTAPDLAAFYETSPTTIKVGLHRALQTMRGKRPPHSKWSPRKHQTRRRTRGRGKSVVAAA